ncbi:MAG: RNA methyltransferase [Phototrophicales bacterium]|nr:MAG: RNA methyltransferase [Phototrophicales bacterium]
MLEIITSPQNSRVKQVRLLLSSSKRRRNEQKIVLEGTRLVQDAIEAGATPDYVLIREDIDSEQWEVISYQLKAQQVPILSVEQTLFNTLSDTQNPQGLLAVFPTPELPIPTNPTLFLIVDHVSDPGNLGTILRSAVAAGVDAILLLSGTVDPYNPKVVRAAMGAHFRIPILRTNWEYIKTLGVQIVGADAQGEQNIFSIDWTKPTALIIGGETYGLSEQAREIADTVTNIPMLGGESLNAAMAATVILFEIMRQRFFA